MKASKKKSHEEHNKNSSSKTISKIALQLFVWALVIAFVSTLGVLWDDTGRGFPTVMKSSKSFIDLSPRNLFAIEFNRIDQEILTNNPQLDPRVVNRYVRNTTLSNTLESFTRMNFYNDIKLIPSPKTYQNFQDNSGLNKELINFQYGEGYMNSPVGALSLISTPTASDVYAINDLNNLTIATELLILNKTNFLLSKISPEQIEEYYQKHLNEWIESITFTEFQAKNRKHAREIAQLLEKQPLEESLESLYKSNDVTISTNKFLRVSRNNFSYFMNIVNSFKSNNMQNTITSPLYNNGQYYIAVIDNVAPFISLNRSTQIEIYTEFIKENYTTLSKEYDKEWNSITKEIVTELNNNESFSAIANKITSVVNQTTQPFTLIQTSITNVLGVALDLPILQNKKILSAVLDTDNQQTSEFISVNKDLQIAVKILQKEYTPSINNQNNLQNTALLQKVYQFKSGFVVQSLNSTMMQKNYNIKIYPKVLSNYSTVSY